ncbi:MAG: hypothetical protein ACUVYA_17225 [Planctomycetota bacterium]
MARARTCSSSGGSAVLGREAGCARRAAWPASFPRILAVAGALVFATALPARDPWDGVQPVAGFVETTGRYRLVEGSTVLETCPGCPVAGVALPIRGEMRLSPDGSCAACPLLLRVEVRFDTQDPEPHALSAKGRGTFRVFGPSEDGAFDRESLRLDLAVSSRGGPARLIRVESGVVRRKLPSPWIAIRLWGEGSSADPPWALSLELVATPWPEVFFSTVHGFTPASGLARASDGDLLEIQGAVAFPFAEIAASVGVRDAARDLGLDAACLRFHALGAETPLGPLPPAELLFSFGLDAASGTLGTLSHGDVLGSSGAVRLRLKDWARAFGVVPVPPDLGLDAVAVAPDGRLLFSTSQGFFSETLGRQVSSGDVLAEDGTIFLAEADLYRAFDPVAGAARGGLDALAVWPHGEVWFSPERDFESGTLGPLRHGDVASDVGRVVLRNAEALAAFSPLEDLADFGLDALSVNVERHFSGCGFLVQGVECVLFEADGGGRYVLADRGGFRAGDRVRVEGMLVSSCATFCGQGDGCIFGKAVERCDFEGCGTLVAGPGDCVVFEADSGRRFLLEEYGDFGVGDRVGVAGPVVLDCNSACVTPCVEIVKNSIGPCVLETCGELVDLGDGCIALETVDGKLYGLADTGEFAASDAVFLVGVVGNDLAKCGPCAGKPGIAGCVEEGEVGSTGGPIGEVGFFRRADCNADGSTDLSDAVFGLMSLFSGGSEPPCVEACNANGDGDWNVTDPIYVLLYLFRGGASPLYPFPGCGEAKLRIPCGEKPCPCAYPEAHCAGNP